LYLVPWGSPRLAGEPGDRFPTLRLKLNGAGTAGTGVRGEFPSEETGPGRLKRSPLLREKSRPWNGFWARPNPGYPPRFHRTVTTDEFLRSDGHGNFAWEDLAAGPTRLLDGTACARRLQYVNVSSSPRHEFHPGCFQRVASKEVPRRPGLE